MKAVADATILIHLAKIGKISLLKKLFNMIIIEKEVYEEIITRGELNAEISIIRPLIEENFIIIKESVQIIDMPHLHKGERKSMSLCRELKIPVLLIDDEEGFNVAAMINLNPMRTTSVLIVLLDKKLISLNEYEESLKDLSESGYFLDASTYQKLIQIGESIAKK